MGQFMLKKGYYTTNHHLIEFNVNPIQDGHHWPQKTQKWLMTQSFFIFILLFFTLIYLFLSCLNGADDPLLNKLSFSWLWHLAQPHKKKKSRTWIQSCTRFGWTDKWKAQAQDKGRCQKKKKTKLGSSQAEQNKHPISPAE